MLPKQQESSEKQIILLCDISSLNFVYTHITYIADDDCRVVSLLVFNTLLCWHSLATTFQIIMLDLYVDLSNTYINLSDLLCRIAR